MGWFRRSEHPEEQLSAYLDGELSARQAEAVERHLGGCAACSALLEELRAAKSMLAAIPRETPRRSFVLGPEHAPERADTRLQRRSVFTFAPAVALTALAVLLVVDVGGLTSSHNESSTALKSTSAPRAISADSAVTGPSIEASGQATPNAVAGSATLPSPSTFGAQIAPQTAPPPAPQAGAGSAGSAGSTASGPDVFAAPETPTDRTAQHQTNGSGSGPSTLRILEVIAGVAFVSSSFYVLVWPRLKTRGEN
jgi:anti-sigma factor RsiW